MSTLTIVMYHYVRPILDSNYPRIKGLEIEGFKRQLDHLASRYAMISPWQLIQSARGVSLPDNACLLTFDDGYKDHLQFVFPELKRRGLSGAFFPPAIAVEQRKLLPVNLVHMILACQPDVQRLVEDLRHECFSAGLAELEFEYKWEELAKPSRYDPKEIVFVKRLLQHGLAEQLREHISEALFKKYVSNDIAEFASEFYLSEDDCRTLLDGDMYVGSHGDRHLWLNKESRESQERDIDGSLRFLAKVGAPTDEWIMCFPYGAYNADTLSVIKAKGAVIGLTTEIAVANMNSANLLTLPRFDTNDFPQ